MLRTNETTVGTVTANPPVVAVSVALSLLDALRLAQGLAYSPVPEIRRTAGVRCASIATRLRLLGIDPQAQF